MDIVFEPEDLVTKPKNHDLDSKFWRKLNSKNDGTQRPLRHKFLNYYLPMPYYVNLPDVNICNSADEFINHKHITKIESYGNDDELPEKDFPEIAFAGRSNVGKSSLMNAIFQKDVALASQLPGRTRRLNHYIIKNYLSLVDFPGYGFAKVDKEISDQWMKDIEKYVKKRMNLLKIFLLVDSKFDLFDSDKEFIDFCKHIGISVQIILTKCDKISLPELSKRMDGIYNYLEKKAVYPLILPCSSEKNLGISDVRGSILESSGLIEAKTLMEKKKAEKEKEQESVYLKEEFENPKELNLNEKKKESKRNNIQQKQIEELTNKPLMKEELNKRKMKHVFGLDDE
eukprot:gene11957-5358_t